MIQQVMPENPYDYSAPRPYAWKTDEFQAQNEPRNTQSVNRPLPSTQPFSGANQQFNGGPLAYQQQQLFAQHFRCPHCMSQYLPRVERRVSTAGWITFAVLMVFFFPLFWIGLLIKEDVQVCQSCNTKLT